MRAMHTRTSAHDSDPPPAQVGSSRFSVADIHRIGILDLRLFNTDRHAGNMLAVRPPRPPPPGPGGGGPPGGWARSRLDSEAMALIPIDHGFCLPEALEPPYFEWLHWAGVRAHTACIFFPVVCAPLPSPCYFVAKMHPC